MANGAYPTIARTHQWLDENGVLAFEHQKKANGSWSYRHPVEGKTCKEHRARANGGWCYRKPAVARDLLWKMQALCDALDNGHDVGWFAGEKDADNAGSWDEGVGLHTVCTSVHQGEAAGTYTEQAELFQGTESAICIYCDDDPTGWKNGINRYAALIAVGITPEKLSIRLPAEGCNDVSDHLRDAQAILDGWREVTINELRGLAAIDDGSVDSADVDGAVSAVAAAELIAVIHTALRAAGCKPASSGQDWTCPHPKHNDRHPSFGVKISEESGKALLNCQKCMPERETPAHKRWLAEVLKVLRLKPSDLKPGARQYSWDDFGNAERLVNTYGGVIRWVRDAATWAVYGDGLWRIDNSGNEVGSLIRSVIIDMSDPNGVEAQSYGAENVKGKGGKLEPSERSKFLKWAQSQRLSNKVEAARKSVGYHPGCKRIDMENFDSDPWVLNVRNGVVNLRDGSLVPHSAEQLLMKQSPLVYAPNAHCPEWEKLISWAHPDDDQHWYMQKVLGYSITGDMSEQAYWTHHGYGRNGKSVAFRVLSAVLGAYAHDLPPKALTVRRNDAHPTELADIAGKRLLMVSELTAGSRYDDAIIKSITGQEPLTARHMRQDNFTFKPIGKIHFLVNSLPGSDGGGAMERRARTVPWTQTVSEREVDRFLAERIIENELAGVLNWLIAGIEGWVREGLEVPLMVAGATKDHIRGGDIWWSWIDDCLEVDETSSLEKMVLYDSYVDWSTANGSKVYNSKVFGQAIRERGFCKDSLHPVTRRARFSGYKFIDSAKLHT